MMAAYISPLFKVATYGVEDKHNFVVKAAYNFIEAGVPLESNVVLYPQKQRNVIFPDCIVPSVKALNIQKKAGPIEILLYYEPAPISCPPCIGYVRLPAVKPEKQQFHLSIKFKMHEDKIIRLQECSLVEEWTEEEIIKKEKNDKKDEKKDDKKDDKKEEKKEMEVEEEVKKVKKHRSTPIKPQALYFI